MDSYQSETANSKMSHTSFTLSEVLQVQFYLIQIDMFHHLKVCYNVIYLLSLKVFLFSFILYFPISFQLFIDLQNIFNNLIFQFTFMHPCRNRYCIYLQRTTTGNQKLSIHVIKDSVDEVCNLPTDSWKIVWIGHFSEASVTCEANCGIILRMIPVTATESSLAQ